MNKNSKILIVGGNGVIEQSLYQRFEKEGFENVFSSSLMGLDTTIQPSVYEFFSKTRPEYVFLSSTKSGGIKANQERAAEFIYHNLESQNNIIYTAQKFGVKKLLYLGGSCVYPKDCPQPIKEEYFLAGKMEETSEAYSIAKAAGIKMCQAFKAQHNFNAIVMIPATVFGPYKITNIESSHVISALIDKFILAAEKNAKQVTVWGSGTPRREFIFVDDFVDACLFLMNSYEGANIVNAGCGYDVSINELVQKIAKICEFKGEIVFDKTKPDGVKQKLLDSRQINELGYKSSVDLDEGIKRTVQWYKNNNLTTGVKL